MLPEAALKYTYEVKFKVTMSLDIYVKYFLLKGGGGGREKKKK